MKTHELGTESGNRTACRFSPSPEAQFYPNEFNNFGTENEKPATIDRGLEMLQN
jgi:hypothetical protein